MLHLSDIMSMNKKNKRIKQTDDVKILKKSPIVAITGCFSWKLQKRSVMVFFDEIFLWQFQFDTSNQRLQFQYLWKWHQSPNDSHIQISTSFTKFNFATNINMQSHRIIDLDVLIYRHTHFKPSWMIIDTKQKIPVFIPCPENNN